MKQFYLFGCLAAACLEIQAASISLNPVADTTISEQNQARAAFNADTMIVGRLTANGAQAKCRDLLQFDLSSLPADITITSVTLTVTITRNHFGGTDSHALHRMNAAWTEALATWDTSGSAAWTGGSFEDEPDSTIGLGSGTFVFPSSPAMIATAQMWQTNGAANYGWIMISADEETPGNARRVGSREAFSGQPTLTIEYTAAPPPPPAPTLGSPRVEEGQFTFDFLAKAGHAYTVEYKDNLNSNQWNTLVMYPAPATDTSIRVSNSVETVRFFRVVAD